MALINTVVLVGHLTRDAEIRYFNNGNAIVKFSIAQNRRKKVGETWQDEAMFFDISFGGKGAEAVHKYLIKGKQVAVQGELRQDRWEKDGQKFSKVQVFVNNLQLLGSARGGTGEGRGPDSGSSSSYRPPEPTRPSGPQKPAADDFDPHAYEDDIPF